MSTKTKAEIERQIANEKARLEKLQKQLKAKEKVERAKAQKERTHRLIQIGGIVEKYCGEIVNFEALEKYVEKYAYAIKKDQIDDNNDFF